jgi:membrane-associated phospholipid phosphatase
MIRQNYAEFYRRISRPFRRYPLLTVVLRGVNRFIEIVMYGAYLVLLAGILVSRWPAGWHQAFIALVPFVLIPGVSFTLLSLIRHWIDAPRPYDQWTIEPLIARDKSGNSMPSRHVFSATIIAMCVLRLNMKWGIAALALAFLLAVIRVLGGVHYPRDVIVGLVVGLIIGSLLFI